jgi:hypothetical protein
MAFMHSSSSCLRFSSSCPPLAFDCVSSPSSAPSLCSASTYSASFLSIWLNWDPPADFKRVGMSNVNWDPPADYSVLSDAYETEYSTPVPWDVPVGLVEGEARNFNP